MITFKESYNWTSRYQSGQEIVLIGAKDSNESDEYFKDYLKDVGLSLSDITIIHSSKVEGVSTEEVGIIDRFE